jgi:hypothetical protein
LLKVQIELQNSTINKTFTAFTFKIFNFREAHIPFEQLRHIVLIIQENLILFEECNRLCVNIYLKGQCHEMVVEVRPCYGRLGIN